MEEEEGNAEEAPPVVIEDAILLTDLELIQVIKVHAMALARRRATHMKRARLLHPRHSVSDLTCGQMCLNVSVSCCPMQASKLSAPLFFPVFSFKMLFLASAISEQADGIPCVSTLYGTHAALVLLCSMQGARASFANSIRSADLAC